MRFGLTSRGVCPYFEDAGTLNDTYLRIPPSPRTLRCLAASGLTWPPLTFGDGTRRARLDTVNDLHAAVVYACLRASLRHVIASRSDRTKIRPLSDAIGA